MNHSCLEGDFRDGPRKHEMICYAPKCLATKTQFNMMTANSQLFRPVTLGDREMEIEMQGALMVLLAVIVRVMPTLILVIDTNNNNSLTNQLTHLLLTTSNWPNAWVLLTDFFGSPLSLVVLLRRAIADLVDFDNGIL